MQIWFLYALIAAVFIGVKDLMTKDLTNRYSYVEYIIVANIMVFAFTIVYIFTVKPKLKKPDLKDGLFIFFVADLIVFSIEFKLLILLCIKIYQKYTILLMI